MGASARGSSPYLLPHHAPGLGPAEHRGEAAASPHQLLALTLSGRWKSRMMPSVWSRFQTSLSNWKSWFM